MLIRLYAGERGGHVPGGGPSGLRLLQRIAEAYGSELQAETFLSPRTSLVRPTRLPNGVLRITRRSSSYRTRALAFSIEDLKSTMILIYEARVADGAGRCLLRGDFSAHWVDDTTFRRLADDQNLFGLPDVLR